MLRSQFRKSRILVPADAFYEWEVGRQSQAALCVNQTGGAPIVFAGLRE